MKAIVVGRAGRFLAIGALAVSGALLSGCGGKTVDQASAEKFIRTSAKAPLKSVKCPSGVDAKAGKSFDCKVTTQQGAKLTVTVHITKVSGKNVFFEFNRNTDVHVGG